MAKAVTYQDFAEDDYRFFKSAYDRGIKGNALAALAQNICERYLKHVVSEYAHPENKEEVLNKEHILRTHSLRRLMGYIHDDMGIEIPEDVEEKLERIDGFYFTTRYPGEESYLASDRDIDKANLAVDVARNFVSELCQEIEYPFMDDFER